jgi:hypothetical protein
MNLRKIIICIYTITFVNVSAFSQIYISENEANENALVWMNKVSKDVSKKRQMKKIAKHQNDSLKAF